MKVFLRIRNIILQTHGLKSVQMLEHIPDDDTGVKRWFDVFFGVVVVAVQKIITYIYDRKYN